MFARVKKSGRYQYVQIVENQRIDGKVRQQVLSTLGRLDQLHDSGHLDGLLVSLAKFSQHSAVLAAFRSDRVKPSPTRHVGPALVFEKLWDQIGMPKLLESLLRDRKFEFAVERAIFVTVLHRLMVSGSDRAAEQWCRSQAIQGIEELHLHQFYRAMAWLGEELPAEQAKLKGPSSPDIELNVSSKAPRTCKDVIEEQLFARRRSLFTNVEMVFFDTTSIYFEGEGGEEVGQRGYSKDHRPDLNQMVVGVVIDNQGRPICSELLPGNTADIKTLLPVIDRLRHRFGISKICVVADRGMISAEILHELEARHLQFILGARLRAVKEIRETVLSDEGPYREVHPPRLKSHDPSPLTVKDVYVDKRRYVACHNEEQATKDRHDREAILAALKDQLKQGPKSLVGNKGYRKYLREKTKGSFEIDTVKVESESRFDGKWVLRTNTDLNVEDVALKYKDLLDVESLFRNMKSVLDTRPIYHKCDATIRGHVFCSFLALILMKELKICLDERGWKVEWSRLIDDLDELQELTLEVDGKRFQLRTPPQGFAGKAIQAVGVALGRVFQEL
jgi:transposase